MSEPRDTPFYENLLLEEIEGHRNRTEAQRANIPDTVVGVRVENFSLCKDLILSLLANNNCTPEIYNLAKDIFKLLLERDNNIKSSELRNIRL